MFRPTRRITISVASAGAAPDLTLRPVGLLVRSAIVVRGTRRWVFPAYGDLVLVDMATMLMVEVPEMKVVCMAVVLHDRVSAVRTMHMRVRFVNVMVGAHLVLLQVVWRQVSVRWSGLPDWLGCFKRATPPTFNQRTSG